MGWKEKASFRKGTNTTAAVTSMLKASVPHSQMFCFLMLNSDRIRERILKEWKISIRLSVRNAMVIPAGDSATVQRPLSIRLPIK